MLPSCFIGEKSKIKKVAGTWHMINTWDPSASSTEDEFWQFEDGSFTRLKGQPPVEFDNAQYFMQQKLSKALLVIDYGMQSGAVPSGTWTIIKLTKKVMIIEKADGGKILREFVKD